MCFKFTIQRHLAVRYKLILLQLASIYREPRRMGRSRQQARTSSETEADDWHVIAGAVRGREYSLSTES